jgi:hypothetical protein
MIKRLLTQKYMDKLLMIIWALSLCCGVQVAHGAVISCNVFERFSEPMTYPSDTIFKGTFDYDTVTHTVSNLKGILSESMTGGDTGYPNDTMTWLTLDNQLVSWHDATLGGTFAAVFKNTTTNTFWTGGGGDGWSPQAGILNQGLYYGFPGTNPENAYALIFVPDDPLAPLTQAQIDKLAYADFAPGGMMGAVGMTGTSVAGYGAVGTMDGYPVEQVITMHTKATVIVTLGNLSQTYDGTAKSATATTTPPGKSVTFTYDGSATAPTNAGSYSVIGTISDPNYQGSASGTLVIDKATATVTLGSLSQTYDGTAKSATATTTPVGKTVTFTYDGSATAPTNAGSYAVIGTISDSNYTGTAGGTLVIDKATATVTLGSLSQTYDGTAKPATATTTPVGKAVTFTYDGGQTAPTNAGSYAVVGTVNDSNYQGSASSTMVIGKATATVTLDNLSQTYDGSAKSATATITPSGKTVTFTYDGSPTAPTNAGSYAVVGTVSDANYTGSSSATLVVGKATPIITWATPAAITFGTALSGTQLNASGSISGTYIYTPPSGGVLPVGTHTLSVAFTPTDTTNYTTAGATVSLTVLPSATYTLEVTLAGNGSGSVNSKPAGIACATNLTSVCNYSFSGDVMLSATESTGSLFDGWSGDCTGVDACNLTMTAASIVTATFSIVPPVRMNGVSYQSLGEAYGIAPDNTIIMLKEGKLSETFSADRSITVTIKGGYNPAYTSISGDTMLRGTVTLKQGKVIFDKVGIR